MPTFEFTSPDGKTYEITGPEGSTKEQAFQQLQTHLGGGDAQTEPAPTRRSFAIQNEYADRIGRFAMPEAQAKSNQPPVTTMPKPSFGAMISALGASPVNSPQEMTDAAGRLAMRIPDAARGVAEAVPGWVLGAGGDVEDLMSYTPYSLGKFRSLPTHGEVTDALFGKSPSLARSIGREIPSIAGPSVVGKAAPIVAGGAKIAGRALERFAPLTESARERNIAEQIRQRASEPIGLEDRVRAGSTEILPGQQPTSYQAFGDEGLGSMEAQSRAQFKEDYAARDTEQATAQRAQFDRSAPQGGSAAETADYVKTRLAALNDATERAIEAARGEARTGAEARPGEGQQTSAYGGELRARAQAAADDSDARHQALFQAIDPTGEAIIDGTPLSQGAAQIRASMTPADVARMSDEEKTLLKLMDETQAREPFRNVASLVREINTEMRTLAAAGKSKSGSYFRVRAMRDAAERAIGTQIETRIAEAAPNEVDDITRELNDIWSAEIRDRNPDIGSLGAARERVAGSSAAPSGAGGQGAPGATGNAANAQGRQLPNTASAQGVSGNLGRPRKQPSVLNQIIAEGGINPTSASSDALLKYFKDWNLTNKQGGNAARRRIYRKLFNTETGQQADTVREYLKEDGWFGRESSGRVATETGKQKGDAPQDLEAMLAEEAAGRPVYHPEWGAPERPIDPDQYLNSLEERAAKLKAQGTDVPRTYGMSPRKWDDALTAAEDAVKDSKEERAAIQAENTQGLDDAARERRDTYRQARTQHAQTFETGPVGAILARGERAGEYRMAEAGAVPGRLFVAGPKGGETIQRYRNAVGDAEALRTLENHAATEIRKYAVDADGMINPGKVQTWLDRHEDAMRAFPELRQRFTNAGAATERVGEAQRAQRVAQANFETDAVKKLLKADTSRDASAAIGTVLQSSNRETQMRRLAALAREDATGNAANGLRAGIRDHVFDKFLNNAGEVKESFQTFMRQNKGALREGGITEDEIKGWQQVADAQAQSAMRGVKPAAKGGGPNAVRTLFWAFARRGVAGTLGILAGSHAGSLGEVFGAAVGAGGLHAIESLRAAGLLQQNELLKNALMNPAALKALLEKIPPGAKPDGALGRLARALSKGETKAALTGAAALGAAAGQRDNRPKSYAETLSQYAPP